MSAETDAERAAMLDPEVFGVSITVDHLAGGQSSFDALFDQEHLPIDVGGELEVSATAPRLVVRDVDVGLVVQGDAVTIAAGPNLPAGWSGFVSDVHPFDEGSGWSLLELADT